MENTEKRAKKYVKKIKPKIEPDEDDESAKMKIVVEKYNNYKYLLSRKQFVLEP